jgi:hypothetical protein
MEAYCFDFVDQQCRPVNIPPEWELFTIPDARNLMPPHRFMSMEAAYGVKQKDILPGEEKYAATEGISFRISIPNQGDIIITIPRRVCSAQVTYPQSTATCAFSASFCNHFSNYTHLHAECSLNLDCG